MKDIDLKSVIHYYLGCEVFRKANNACDYEVAKLVGVCTSEVEEGRIISQVDTGDEEEHHYHEWYVEETILSLRKLSSMTEEEAVEVAEIIGGASHLTRESQIHQVRELMEGVYNKQTNIPGARWFRLQDYLRKNSFDADRLIERGFAVEKK